MPSEDELYRRYAPLVALFGRRHLGDAAAAEDLVQQVLAVVLRRLREGTLDEPSRLAPFVLETARRTAAALRRQEARRQAAHQALAAQPPATPPPEPLDRRRLAACLQALPDRERLVVVQTFFAEAEAAAIAADLGTTAGNVRVLRHRALGRLLGCMGVAS